MSKPIKTEAELLACLDLGAHLREVHERDVGQLGLREVGDSDARLRSIHSHPLVTVGVAAVVWDLVGLRAHPPFLKNGV